MFAWIRNGLITLAVLGVGYGIWIYFNGDPATFLTTISDIIGGIVGVIGHIFAGLLGALHVPNHKG